MKEQAKEMERLQAENKALAEDLRNSLEDAVGARNQLVITKTALEKIAGHREFSLEDYERADQYKRSEGVWTLEESIADIALCALTDEKST